MKHGEDEQRGETHVENEQWPPSLSFSLSLSFLSLSLYPSLKMKIADPLGFVYPREPCVSE